MAVIKGPARFLAEDIFDMPEDGQRYEVVDGDLYVTPAPGMAHQNAVGFLYVMLVNYLSQNPLGQVFIAPFAVVLDQFTGVEPDLVYVARERRDILQERGVFGAPDLAVEVISPSSEGQDRGAKLRRYAAAGIPHYWILHPFARTLEAYELAEQGYTRAALVDAGETFQPRLFPGLEIPLAKLFV